MQASAAVAGNGVDADFYMVAYFGFENWAAMNICITEARGRLGDLVRRAQAGEDIVLTLHGDEVVRLVALALPPKPVPREDERARKTRSRRSR